MAGGGVFLPDFEDGLYEFAPCVHLAARTAGALKDVGGASSTDSKNISLELHLNWGRVPERQLGRISVVAEGAK